MIFIWLAACAGGAGLPETTLGALNGGNGDSAADGPATVAPPLVGVATVRGFGFGFVRFVFTEMVGGGWAFGLVSPGGAGSSGRVAVAGQCTRCIVEGCGGGCSAGSWARAGALVEQSESMARPPNKHLCLAQTHCATPPPFDCLKSYKRFARTY